MLYTVKTVVGRENVVIDSLTAKARSENIAIKSVLHPEEIRGYIFVEGDVKEVEKVIQLVPHVRGLIKRPVDISEVQRFLQPKKVEIELGERDIVEVIGGPFKGEKGKVTRYDKIKREITIELVEAAVPIPLTVSVEFVKVLEKTKK